MPQAPVLGPELDAQKKAATDRSRSLEERLDALRRGFEAITVASCGNYGAAVALASATAGLDCFIYIPERNHTRRTQEMVDAGVRLIRIPGDYEAAVEASRERAEAQPSLPGTFSD